MEHRPSFLPLLSRKSSLIQLLASPFTAPRRTGLNPLVSHLTSTCTLAGRCTVACAQTGSPLFSGVLLPDNRRLTCFTLSLPVPLKLRAQSVVFCSHGESARLFGGASSQLAGQGQSGSQSRSLKSTSYFLLAPFSSSHLLVVFLLPARQLR